MGADREDGRIGNLLGLVRSEGESDMQKVRASDLWSICMFGTWFLTGRISSPGTGPEMAATLLNQPTPCSSKVTPVLRGASASGGLGHHQRSNSSFR